MRPFMKKHKLCTIFCLAAWLAEFRAVLASGSVNYQNVPNGVNPITGLCTAKLRDRTAPRDKVNAPRRGIRTLVRDR